MDFEGIFFRDNCFELKSPHHAVVHKYDFGTYPLTGMIIKMKRKSLGLLLGGYYYPTTAFALLSMISFLINPDIVSIAHIAPYSLQKQEQGPLLAVSHFKTGQIKFFLLSSK